MARAGQLDRRIQFRRASAIDDGFDASLKWNTESPEADNHGQPVWASKMDLSDGERWRANEVQAHVTARFIVRSSAFTRAITPKDRLVCEGRTYDISGIKEAGGRLTLLEITASARAD